MFAKKKKKKEKKMKLRCGDPHLYLRIQKGGSIPIFRGVRRRGGGFSFKILKPFAKVIGKSLLNVGKNVIKKAAPDILDTALEAGTNILHRKKPLKNVAKGALTRASRSLMKNTRESIEQELANHGKKRGGGLMSKRSQKMVVNRKRKVLHR